jgi:oligoribonuclease NrnB/cAMP/cGMP phosphodiesterase (DHH superfamily)
MSGIAAHIINVMYDKKYCDEIIVSPNYNKTNYLDEYDEITCVDIVPFNEEQYNELINKGKKIFIYDHHLSNEWCSKYPNCIVNDSECGSLVYYNAIKPRNIRYLWYYLSNVDKYDRWVTDDKYFERSLSYNRIFMKTANFKGPIMDIQRENNGFSKYIRNIVHKISSENNAFTEEERKIISECRSHERKEFGYIMHNIKIYTDKRGNKYGCISVFPYSNNIIHEVMMKKPELRYIIIIRNKSISVRSTDFDVTTLDHVNGHRYAGGAKLDKESVDKILSGELSL